MRPPESQTRYTPVPNPTVRRPLPDIGPPGYDRVPAVVWTAQPPVPLPPPATSPFIAERPVARATGVTAYGVALAVGLAVAVGGLSFAAGRMTADEPSTGGGGLAAFAAGAGAGPDPGSGTGLAPGTGTVDTGLGSAPEIAAGATPADRSGGGFSPAGAGAFALGGLEGTVGELTDGGFTLTTPDGGSLDIRIDDGTTYVRTSPVSPDGIAVGDTVRIELAGGASDPTVSLDAAAQLAASVTVVAPDPTGDATGGAVGVGAPDAGGTGPMDLRPRGVLGMPTGTIEAMADETLTLTLADGQSIDVTTDASTAFWQEQPSTAQEIIPGASVRLRPSFAGPLAPGGGDQAAGPLTVSRVTLVADVT